MQTEDDDLELALTLSLLEVEDRLQSTPSRPQQLGGDTWTQINSVNLASVSQGISHSRFADVVSGRKTVSSPLGGPQFKGSRSQVTQETELQKSTNVYQDNLETPGTRQTVSVSKQSTSISKQVPADVSPSETAKRSKNRRQRRKGATQKVVGLPSSPSRLPPVLLWFRRDLRLCDNPALMASLEAGAPVIPVFIWSPEEEEGPGLTVAMGGACKFIMTLARQCWLCCF